MELYGIWSCDPIGGVAKRKADQAVKNGRFIIQDAIDFFEWAKQDSSSIKFSYLSIEDYEISEKFLKATCENLQLVKGTMKVHGVFSLKPNTIWVRDTSCFCSKCFNQRFQKDSCCKGWRECLLTSTRKKSVGETSTVKKAVQNDEPEETIEDLQSTSVIPEAGDYVAAIYERKPYIGQVEEIDEEDEEAHMDFLKHSGILTRLSKFKKPKKVDKVWIPLVDIICIVPEPTATKRALEIYPEVLENVLEKFKVM